MLVAHSSHAARRGKAPRAGHAYEHLKARILEGDLGPGDRLSVLALAQALACSRVPVMEALKRLQAEGLVDIVPQVGCQVAVPTAGDVEDFLPHLRQWKALSPDWRRSVAPWPILPLSSRPWRASTRPCKAPADRRIAIPFTVP